MESRDRLWSCLKDSQQRVTLMDHMQAQKPLIFILFKEAS
jgi:hypothetical protein